MSCYTEYLMQSRGENFLMIAMMHCDDFVITYYSSRLPFLPGHIRLSSCLKVILMKIDEVVLRVCTYILELDILVPWRYSRWEPLAATARTHATQLSRVRRRWCNCDIPRQPINTWLFVASIANNTRNSPNAQCIHVNLRACNGKIQFV